MVDERATSVIASSKVAAVCELVDNIIPSQKKKNLKKNKPNTHRTNKGGKKAKILYSPILP